MPAAAEGDGAEALRHMCRACEMRFARPEQLQRHQQKFCSGPQAAAAAAQPSPQPNNRSPSPPLPLAALAPTSDIESLILLDSGSDLPDVSVLHARYASMDAGDKSARLATLKKRQEDLRAQHRSEEQRLSGALAELEQRKKNEMRVALAREKVKATLAKLGHADLGALKKSKEQALQQVAAERDKLRQQEAEAREQLVKLTADVEGKRQQLLAEADRGLALSPLSKTRVAGLAELQARAQSLATERGKHMGELALRTQQLQTERDNILRRLDALKQGQPLPPSPPRPAPVQPASDGHRGSHGVSRSSTRSGPRPSDVELPPPRPSSQLLASGEVSDLQLSALRARHEQMVRRDQQLLASADELMERLSPQKQLHSRSPSPSPEHSRAASRESYRSWGSDARPDSRDDHLSQRYPPDSRRRSRMHSPSNRYSPRTASRRSSATSRSSATAAGRARHENASNHRAAAPAVDPILSDIAKIRKDYIARGGNDPAVLQQMKMMEDDALAMRNKADRSPAMAPENGHHLAVPPPGPMPHAAAGITPSRQPSMMYAAGGVPPFAQMYPHDPLMQQLMRMEAENAMLQREIEIMAHGAAANGAYGHAHVQVAKSPEELEHEEQMRRLEQETEYLRKLGELEKLKRELRREEEAYQRQPSDPQSSSMSANRVDLRTPLEQDADISNAGPYSPDAGFVVYWDFLSGLPPFLSHCSLVFGLFENGKSIVSSEVIEGLDTETDPDDGHTRLCRFDPGQHFHVRDCPLRPGLHMIMELRDDGPDGLAQPVAIAWTKLYFFDAERNLGSGRWRLRLFRLPVQPDALSTSIPTLPPADRMELCVRVVDGRFKARHDALAVSPNRHCYLPNGVLGGDLVAMAERAKAKIPPKYKVGTVPPPPDEAPDDVANDSGAKPVTSAGKASAPAQAASTAASPKVVSPKSVTPATVSGKRGNQDSLYSDESESESDSQSQYSDLDDDHPQNTFFEIPGGVTVIVHVQKLIDVVKSPELSVAIKGSVLDGTAGGGPVPEGQKWTSFEAAENSGGVQEIGDEATFKDVFIQMPTTILFQILAWRQGDQGRRIAGWATLPLLPDGPDTLNSGLHRLAVYKPPVMAELPEDERRLIPGARLHIAVRLAGEESHAPVSKPPAALAAAGVRPSLLPAPSCPPHAWIACQRKHAPTDFYRPGSGFDLYIDGARFLPYNCTISKVVGRIFNARYERQGADISTNIDLDSDMFNPTFSFRLEFRDNVFTPTATMLLKIYTIDVHTKSLVVVGYTALNLFVESGSERQPSTDDDSIPISLNEGAHQCRLFRFGPNTDAPLSTQSLNPQDIVPCASLLVRLLRPPTDSNGNPLSTADVPRDEWLNIGLDVPAPSYTDGVYLSEACRPSDLECALLKQLTARKPVLVRDCLSLVGDGRERRLKTDKTKQHWIRSRLTRPTGVQPPEIDLGYLVKYEPDQGFQLTVDSARNLPKAKISHAIVSLAPPAVLYRDRPGDSTVKMTESFAFQSEDCCLRHPEWTEHFVTFRRRAFHPNLTVILDVRGIEKSAKGVSFVKQGWTAVQIFTPDGFVKGGRFQAPLFQGTPTPEALLALKTEKVDEALAHLLAAKKIKHVEGGSITYRIADSRLAVCVHREDEPDQSLLPTDKKYKGHARSKHVSSAVPKGSNSEAFFEEVASDFKQLLAGSGSRTESAK